MGYVHTLFDLSSSYTTHFSWYTSVPRFSLLRGLRSALTFPLWSSLSFTSSLSGMPSTTSLPSLSQGELIGKAQGGGDKVLGTRGELIGKAQGGSYESCIFGRRFLWSILRQDFCTIRKLQDLAAARLIFVVVAALDTEGCCCNVEWLLPQWLDSKCS